MPMPGIKWSVQYRIVIQVFGCEHDDVQEQGKYTPRYVRLVLAYEIKTEPNK